MGPDVQFDDFATRIGEEFRIRFDDGQTRPLRLVSATARDEKVATAASTPSRFSVLFHDEAASAARHLPQCTYRMEHATLGELWIFMVPIGPGEGGQGVLYEAIFNRMSH